MGVQTMNNIGELKLHIRDEHVQLQTKKRLKKIFHSRAAAVPPPPPPPPVNPSPALNPFDNDSDGSDEIFDVPFRSRQASNDFESVANRFVDLANNDITETDPEPIRMATFGPQPIHKLFDFTRKHWVDTFSKSAMRSFDEELELYELLDLDAAGEDDIANDLDEDTAEALLRG
jgi:hypothetical protein